MRDVVVIGGGLSGLSACYELEKQQLPYTVIEVKRRFGGGIRSISERGFIMDASAFAFRPLNDEPLLAELDLQGQLFPLDDETLAFRAGTESLIGALAGKLRGGRLMRMAVSSIGRLDGRFTICLENGIMLDAGALILAAPARYAARMLYNLAPEAAERLRAFRYDAIRRVSLGYHKRDLPERIGGAHDRLFPFVIATDQPGRAPDPNHVLIQVGLRCSGELPPAAIIREVTRHFGWSGTPLVSRVDYWAEADSLWDFDAAHRENIAAIRELLPAGISLSGSDYCLEAPEVRGIARLNERIRAGSLAAREAAAFLQASKRL